MPGSKYPTFSVGYPPDWKPIFEAFKARFPDRAFSKAVRDLIEAAVVQENLLEDLSEVVE